MREETTSPCACALLSRASLTSRIPHASATKAKSLALVFSLVVLFLQFREVVNSPIT